MHHRTHARPFTCLESLATVIQSEVVRRGAENCYYMGHVEGMPDSAVAVNTCEENSLFGLIWAGGERYVIEAAHKHDGYQLQNASPTRKIIHYTHAHNCSAVFLLHCCIFSFLK